MGTSSPRPVVLTLCTLGHDVLTIQETDQATDSGEPGINSHSTMGRMRIFHPPAHPRSCFAFSRRYFPRP